MHSLSRTFSELEGVNIAAEDGGGSSSCLNLLQMFDMLMLQRSNQRGQLTAHHIDRRSGEPPKAQLP